jgi:hypothetical protein
VLLDLLAEANLNMGTGLGYPIAEEAFDFELFQLASTFAASTELARLSEKHKGIGQLEVHL